MLCCHGNGWVAKTWLKKWNISHVKTGGWSIDTLRLPGDQLLSHLSTTTEQTPSDEGCEVKSVDKTSRWDFMDTYWYILTSIIPFKRLGHIQYALSELILCEVFWRLECLRSLSAVAPVFTKNRCSLKYCVSVLHNSSHFDCKISLCISQPLIYPDLC